MTKNAKTVSQLCNSGIDLVPGAGLINYLLKECDALRKTNADLCATIDVLEAQAKGTE